jgi:hypothetical protein
MRSIAMLRTLFSCNRLLAAGAVALCVGLVQPVLAQTADMTTDTAGDMAGSNDRQDAAVAKGTPFTQALNLLERHGYASFTNFREEGGQFGADVTENGRTYHVIINPDSNQITEATSSSSSSSGVTQSGAAQ